MTIPVTLDATWKQIDTSKADVLITGNFILFMGGSAAPGTGSAGHFISIPTRIPKGVGAWIRGGAAAPSCVISVMDAVGDATTNPIKP